MPLNLTDDEKLAIWTRIEKDLDGLTATQVERRVRREALLQEAANKHAAAVEAAKPIVDAAIRTELADDPAGLGYSGKTKQEQCDLFNHPRRDEDGNITLPARANTVLAGLAGAPNAVTPEDLTRIAGI